jgi:hypothetical protein
VQLREARTLRTVSTRNIVSDGFTGPSLQCPHVIQRFATFPPNSGIGVRAVEDLGACNDKASHRCCSVLFWPFLRHGLSDRRGECAEVGNRSRGLRRRADAGFGATARLR